MPGVVGGVVPPGGVVIPGGVVVSGVAVVVELAETSPVALTLKLKVLLDEACSGPPADTLMRHFPSEAVAVTA